MSLSIPILIAKKRDKKELTAEEIKCFVDGVTNGSVQESQIGAMLMAIFLNGLNDAETVDLTKYMTFSGETLQFPSEWAPKLVDKHSTGGVGDKISLILAPALASLGLKVPMVSGRGLGFTGGTLDKLESFPGFKTQLTNEEMTRCLTTAGCFIGGAGNSLAPADGILYKQRDVTSTVGCLPLIVSSILSKKVAEGTKFLVMDVKVGRGTFMKTEEEATELANKLVTISQGLGVKTRAVLSRMDYPIGCAIGNALEVNEALQCLKNKGPNDVTALVTTLGGVLLECHGLAKSLEEGEKLILQTLESGEALETFEAMLVEQGVSKEYASGFCKEDPKYSLKTAKYKTFLNATESGYITDINALDVAMCCWHLGAGRTNASDPVDHAVGIVLLKQVGDQVEIGSPWAVAHHNTEVFSENLRDQLIGSIKISDNYCKISSNIIKIV